MKRLIAILLIFTCLLTALPVAVSAEEASPLYIVDLVEQNKVSGDIVDGVYRRSGCQREYASTGAPSGTPVGAVWLGTTDGTAYREFLNGFRFHTQPDRVVKYTFTMPEGYNTFSGTTGVCWHIDSPNVGYNNVTTVTITVDGARVWTSGAIQIQTGYDFTVNAPAGAKVTVAADSVNGNTGYGHVCFGDPVLTFDPDYIPVEPIEVAFNTTHAAIGQPLIATIDAGEREIDPEYLWSIDGKEITADGDTYIPEQADLEKTITCAVRDRASDQILGTATILCSKLPVFYINTDDGGAITSKDYYKSGTMLAGGDTTYAGVQYDGAIEIKGRGNAAWGAPKKSYRIKLEKKADLLGMGASKHWVMLANYQDECLLRNKIGSDLGLDMGLVGMESRWVDVIFNGQHAGNYLLMEHIRIGETRVDITDFEEIAEDVAKAIAQAHPDTVIRASLETYLTEHLEWLSSGVVDYNGVQYTVSQYYDKEIPSLTGGVLLEMDRYNDEPTSFWTDHGLLIKVNRPEYTGTNEELMAYITDYTQALEDACYSENFYTEYQGENLHYSDLADVDSMIRWFLVQEVFFNWDAGYNSNFLYKETDGKMVFGPVWDMDLTAGGYLDSWRYDQWQIWYYTRDGIQNIWFKELMGDPYFVTKVQECYWKYRPLFEQMLDDIDTYYDYLKESGAKNTELWRNQRGFEEDYRIIKQWFDNRFAWLDKQFADEETFMRSIGRVDTDDSVKITVTHADGSALAADTLSDIPAHGMVEDGGDIKLSVTAEGRYADIYLNGKRYMSLTLNNGAGSITIPAAALIPENEDKAVLTVVEPDGGRNYVTLALEPAEQTGIELVSLPNKLDYAWGEELELDGLQVSSVWSDGVLIANAVYTVEGYDPKQVGAQVITVKSGEFTAQFTVTIKEPSLTELTVTASEAVYSPGHIFTPDDFTVRATYADGRVEVLTEFTLTAEYAENEWVVTITAGGVTQSIRLATPDPTPPTPSTYPPGDVDQSGVVDVADILKLKTLIMTEQWSDIELSLGDVAPDDRLDVADIMGVKVIIMNG